LKDQPVDPKVAARLLQVLRNQLSDDPMGKEILARFEKAPKANSHALADYLQRRLGDDQVFRERLAEAPGLPVEMRALVYGGQVGQITQIAGSVTYGIPMWIGLTAVIFSVISVGALVLSIIPKPLPPMGNGFNVAVAEFAMFDSKGHISSSDVSRQFSAGLYTTINNETKLLPTALSVELRGPKDVGVVDDDETARTTAERLNATILIYGHVESDLQGSYQVEPRFFISDMTFSYGSEVTGPDFLGEPITGVTLGPDGQFAFNNELNSRIQALQHIVRGLAYFSIRDYESAANEFQDAVNTPGWEPQEGQEVAYLLLGAARLRPWDLIQNPETLPKAGDAFSQAYKLNHNYVRSYLGLAAVALAEAQILNPSGTRIGAVDREKLNESIRWYSACLNQTEPSQAYIPTKAAFGLGQAYLLAYEFRVIRDSKKLALENLLQVIEKFNAEPVPDLAWFAGHAHAYVGRLAGLDSDWKTMSDEHRRAIQILERMQPNLPKLWIARYWSNVAFAEEKQKHPELAQDAFERAIELGSGVVSNEELDLWQKKLDQVKKETP
jgi:tetratricopeptide (TPR) repeat protein